MNEIWLNIKCFPDYQVSSEGRVRSKDRTVIGGRWKCKRKLKGVILKEALTVNGYAFVTLRKRNRAYTKKVHHLVAESFLGDRITGLVVHHIDGEKLNNCVSNLTYITQSENTHEYHKSTGFSKGTIPIEDIKYIKNRINNGEKIYKIAEEYNVNRNDITCLYRVIALTGEELKIK